MKESTTKFEVIKIIYDDGEFAIAKGTWTDDGRSSIGLRWYSEGIGFPNSFGKGQWLVLPKEFTPIVNQFYKDFKKKRNISKIFENIK